MTQLAAAVSMHQAQVSLIENGRALPSSAQLTRLARTLRVPACELLAEIKHTEVRERP